MGLGQGLASNLAAGVASIRMPRHKGKLNRSQEQEREREPEQANVSSTYGQKCQYCPCTKYTIYLDSGSQHDSGRNSSISIQFQEQQQQQEQQQMTTTNSPVNWQVKHRTWQAIGSHLAAAGRIAPQIPYPDAKLQRTENRRNEKREKGKGKAEWM